MPGQATQLNDFVVAGRGIATVFGSLICIIRICNITGATFKKYGSSSEKSVGRSDGQNTQTEQPSQNAVMQTQSTAANVCEYVPAKIENRGEVIAAISAAIAEDCGTDISRIRILSVRERANAIPDREKLCAAISAVIAQETGAEHVRIHSIRRVDTDREKLCAVISAAIAQETGAERVRIHSIRKI